MSHTVLNQDSNDSKKPFCLESTNEGPLDNGTPPSEGLLKENYLNAQKCRIIYLIRNLFLSDS